MLSKFWLRKVSNPYFFIVLFGSLIIIFFSINTRKKLFHNEQEITKDQLTLRESISVLAANPNWDLLKNYHDKISKKEFLEKIKAVYSEGDAWQSVAKVGENFVDIKTSKNNFIRIYFSSEDLHSAVPRYWRKANEMPKLRDPKNQPLEDLIIAIDPGHIGGRWAKMEGRWYQINNSGIEIKEGELTLKIAKRLKEKLERLGSKVNLVRKRNGPVNKLHPEDFVGLAKKILRSKGLPLSQQNVKRESELIFYRKHEIRRRAYLINKKIKPDITICIHFNAESWGNPTNPKLTDNNHLHLLVNGNYSHHEFRLEDNRYHLFMRLFQNIHGEEFELSKSIAKSLAEETRLPPYVYKTSNAKLIDKNEPYIYARNLLANRIYHCPVIFLEPYVMNSKSFYHRAKLGSYKGLKIVDGIERKNLTEEYTDGIAKGLIKYYAKMRK